MKNNVTPNSQDEPRKETVPAKALHKVLNQSEQVKKMVEQAAEELSSVNTDIKTELTGGETVTDMHPGIESALEKSEQIEDKVQAASEKLADVNLALEAEIHERKQLEKQLAAVTEEKEEASYAAVHDTLTGLPNRALFGDRLEHAIAHARRHKQNVAVMFVDLDDFKAINDTHGHAAGDSVLQTIASRLRASTRAEDSIGRLGGDEFLFLLIGARNEREVAQIAEKTLASIQSTCQITVGDVTHDVQINASLGIALFPKDGDTAETMIESADRAMYAAKQDKAGFMFAVS